MKKKILIIANCKAGRGKMKKHITKMVEKLQKLDYEVDVKYTSLEKNATNIIQDYEKTFDKLIVCGGDGTLNQATQGLCEQNRKVPVGYVALGTTNDFSKSLGIVRNNPLDISENIKKYEEKEVDVGKFNHLFFNYVASIGVFSKASYSTKTSMKNKFGRMAYLCLGVKELFFHETYHLKLLTKSNIIEDDFIYGSVSNSKYVGGFGIFKNEKIDLADGEFEVIFVKKPKTVFQTLKLAIKVTTGHLQDKNVYYFKTSDLKIESQKETVWSIDGECSGNVKNVEILNLPKKMNYLIPKRRKNK